MSQATRDEADATLENLAVIQGWSKECEELRRKNKELLDLVPWKAMQLEPGDIVLLQAPEDTPQLAMERASKVIQHATKDLGIKFMLIPFGWTPYVLRD